MERVKKLVEAVVIIAIILAIGFFMGMGYDKGIEDDPIPKTIEFNDSLEIKGEVKPDTIRDTLILPPEPLKIDSAQVVRDYYTMRTLDTTVVKSTPNSEIKIRFTGQLHQNSLRNVKFYTSAGYENPLFKPKLWSIGAGALAGQGLFMPLLSVGYKKHEILLGRNLIDANGWYVGYKATIFSF